VGPVKTDAGETTEAQLERRLCARRPDPELDRLLGTSQHAELRELAAKARKRRGGERVLILPGIMGSQLGVRRPGRSDDVKWFDPVEIALGGLVKLALPSSRRLQPLGVLLFVYLRLKLSLRAAGLDADFHPYDWRLDLATAGRGLARRIRQERRRKVRLVAHSMGGLVARAALAYAGSERIGRVVQLGTPNGGAFSTVQALRGNYPLVQRLALLDLAHSAGQLAREVFCTLPGLSALLPDAGACEDFDPFVAGDWPRGPRPRAALLDAARAARQALPAPDERFFLVAGVDRETPCGLRRRGGILEFRYGNDGDGTVPLDLARLPGLACWITTQAHGALPGDEQVTRAAIDLLDHGSTHVLPRSEPGRAQRGRWVAESPLEPAASKLFWDDLADGERREFLQEYVGPPALPQRDGPSQPAELGVQLGDVVSLETEAIVLGLFNNVDPAGAALAVDQVLGGTIRDLSRRRALNALAGEVFILPVAAEGLAARYVVFAGLGHFARFGSAVQRLAAANVTRSLSLAGIREFSWVLWGTASGIPPAHAAQSQLAGLLDALAELDPQRRPRRVTLLSRSLRRLKAAHAAMDMMLAGSPHAGLARLAPAPGAGPRRARGAAPAAAASYLFVQEDGPELRAALLGATPKATALAATHRLDSRALAGHLDLLGAGLEARDVPAFGARLGELLLPEATRAALSSVREAPLVVVHDHAASRWPWETLSIDGWSPAAMAGLSRRYAAEDMSVAKWREDRRLSPKLELLLVINPTEDLPGADQEGRRVARVLQKADVGLTTLHGGEATRARLLQEFRSGRYDAIHYAGHAFFDAASPGASGILCAGGRVLSGGDLASLDSLPALVCFNACESGRVRQSFQVQRAIGRSTGFAEAFLRGGVANFIGTWWPVSDAAASRFASTLYEQLLRGVTIGAALQEARGVVRRLGSADWANYLHYGGFDFSLKRR
jgi:hypothetical protein